jgi:hypothetical protein
LFAINFERKKIPDTNILFEEKSYARDPPTPFSALVRFTGPLDNVPWLRTPQFVTPCLVTPPIKATNVVKTNEKLITN